MLFPPSLLAPRGRLLLLASCSRHLLASFGPSRVVCFCGASVFSAPWLHEVCSTPLCWGDVSLIGVLAHTLLWGICSAPPCAPLLNPLCFKGFFKFPPWAHSFYTPLPRPILSGESKVISPLTRPIAPVKPQVLTPNLGTL